ncbi:hypothetical protein [Micromonospora sp. NPDC049107]|uniref:hypothetical protein n=1 Tax=unclassified Micromonospora TaxID=2617518 RepID=UPI003404B1DA
MRHTNQSTDYRRSGNANSTRRHRFVLVGQKDFYDPSNPADLAEYRMVVRYRHH